MVKNRVRIVVATPGVSGGDEHVEGRSRGAIGVMVKGENQIDFFFSKSSRLNLKQGAGILLEEIVDDVKPGIPCRN